MSCSYVKCYLLPDKSKFGKRKTTVKKKTSHPTFNEVLRVKVSHLSCVSWSVSTQHSIVVVVVLFAPQFKIPLEALRTQNLNMSVWHNDTFGRNSFLGEVDVDLSRWDFANTQINEYPLQARVGAPLDTFTPVVPVLFTRSSRWNVSGLRAALAVPSVGLAGRQRTHESRFEIPATDVPR